MGGMWPFPDVQFELFQRWRRPASLGQLRPEAGVLSWSLYCHFFLFCIFVLFMADFTKSNGPTCTAEALVSVPSTGRPSGEKACVLHELRSSGSHSPVGWSSVYLNTQRMLDKVFLNRSVHLTRVCASGL